LIRAAVNLNKPSGLRTKDRGEKMIHIPLSWPWWRWAMTGLSALALTLSGYLGWHFLVGGTVIGCDGGSACDQVLNSRWSAIGGVVPVSGLAAGVYLAMLVASLGIGPATAAPVRRLAWSSMLVLAGAIGGSALWFTIVQKWIVGTFCPYCMITHTAGLLLTALVIWRAPRPFDHGSTDVDRKKPALIATTSTVIAVPIECIPKSPPERGHSCPQQASNGSTICSVSKPNLPSDVAADKNVRAPVRVVSPAGPGRIIGLLPVIGLVLVGLTLAGILAACQFVIPSPAVYRDGESHQQPPSIDPRRVPLVGSPEAPYVVTLLFDYQCPHCQQLHFLLEEAIRRYQGKLAFALCPAPLSRQCNPYIPREVDKYQGSCELVKVGLAVWVARREAFPAFNRWMFTLESGDYWRPRKLDAAKAKAVELVGLAKFEAAQANPWIDRFMQTSIQIYGSTIEGGNAVPKLVFGSRWVTPEVQDADDLVLILHNSLGVPKP
jgi:uncharacterized membrane protein/protein-disulfide isomerase